ncbi:unnamed protein product [Ixodes pacificus]
MSSNTSPAHHRFSGDYDAFYDPEFTAEISNKMRVPQKISVVDQDEYKLIEDMGPNKLHFNDAAYMHVPDRILVRGEGPSTFARHIPPDKTHVGQIGRHSVNRSDLRCYTSFYFQSRRSRGYGLMGPIRHHQKGTIMVVVCI